MPDIDRAIYQFQRTDEESFTREQAKKLHLPYVNLVGYPMLANTLRLISYEDCQHYRVIPFLKVGTKLRVAIAEAQPAVLTFLQTVANRYKLEISPALVSDSSINFGLRVYQTEEQKTAKNLQVDISTKAQTSALQAITSKQELADRLAKANATEVIDILFAAATGMEASDIHIEPQENNVRVRFRIDGVLQEITTLASPVYKQLISRVKFLAHMKFDITQVNQDGRFSIKLADTSLDVRVATLPSAFGEIIDMRLLRAQAQFIHLSELELTPEALAHIEAAMQLPHGMILVTGPTGSGKTTTLYAVLDTLNKSGVKIITIEDPIEYRIAGIDQVQVQPDKGFTYSEALKGVLRQDPDIIMVGEIRDKDTATIGLQAAMTGHLFLSTLHTNNAPASLSRLIDMGIEPYKIAGAINLIIAQRLVRKLCVACQGKGCPECSGSGFKGRLPIIEILKPSKALDEAIVARASVRQLYDIAIAQGMIPMYDDGVIKVNQGLTTLDEVKRVTAEVEEG